MEAIGVLAVVALFSVIIALYDITTRYDHYRDRR